jgi:tRNA threonylcarbamoyladenosine biosynthesis protein TsaB
MTDTLQQSELAGRAKEPGLVLGLVLGIDTCGPTGSVALARIGFDGAEILAEKELAGRSYSATLILAVDELLSRVDTNLGSLRAIVVVNGPGSFTGVRVGVSAAKGLAEGRALGVVPVSRLEVLGAKAGLETAALDAHRSEIFLRLGRGGELLAGRDEMAALDSRPRQLAVCDDAAADLLGSVWPDAVLTRIDAPTAGDAILHCAKRIATGEFADVALLDGHYLRRSDAEIFGEPGARAKRA